MPCTVWPPRFQRWFEKRFGDLCKTHDQQYMLHYHSKWAVDWWLVTRIRGYPETPNTLAKNHPNLTGATLHKQHTKTVESEGADGQSAA